MQVLEEGIFFYELEEVILNGHVKLKAIKSVKTVQQNDGPK